MNAHALRKARLQREWLLTAVIAALLLVLFVFADVSRPLGNVIYDHFMRWHGFKAPQDVVIIAVDDRSLQELHGWPLKRDTYKQLAEQLNDPRFRPKALGLDLLFLDPTPDDDALALSLQKLPTVLPLEFKPQNDAPQTYLPSPPVGALAHAAKLGHINLTFDPDGVIRAFKPLDQNWGHFALMLRQQGDPAAFVPSTQSQLRFRMVDPRIGFPMVSLVDAIHNDYTKTLFKNKYVLLGVTAPSLSDRYPTLYAGNNNASTPGVAILASILSASLDQSFIREAEPWQVFLGAALSVFVMLQSLVLLKPRQSLVLSLLLILLCGAASYALLTVADIWVDPAAFVLVTLIVQPFWAWRRLEAIVHVVQDKAADLQQFQSLDRGDTPQPHRSREIVLQYSKLLDHAVASARSELDFLSTVIDEMPDAVAIFDGSDQLLLANSLLKSLFGDHKLVKGNTAEQIAKTIGLPLNAVMNFGGKSSDASQQATYALPTLSGDKEFYVKTTLIPSPLEGSVRLVILVDVTDLRQSQIQRDRALQFLSHDMRTPVASIMSITQSDGLRSEEREKIRHHSRALLNMMDDFILTISAEATQYKLKEELLDNILNDAVEQVSDLATAKGIRIQDDAPASSLFIMANTRLLVRAMVNLLFNAIKFSPPNSRLVIYTRHLQVEQKAQISISNPVQSGDTQVDLIPSMPGFGLGLDFVDIVIRKHQGRIDRRIPQEGVAHVCIELPCFEHGE